MCCKQTSNDRRRSKRLAVLRAEPLKPLDIPVWEAVFSGGCHDPIYVIVCRWFRNHVRTDIAKSRLPLSVERFCKYGLGQVGFTQNILGVHIQATEFSVPSGSENAIDGVLIG